MEKAAQARPAKVPARGAVSPVQAVKQLPAVRTAAPAHGVAQTTRMAVLQMARAAMHGARPAVMSLPAVLARSVKVARVAALLVAVGLAVLRAGPTGAALAAARAVLIGV
jgi:hypothetical protein